MGGALCSAWDGLKRGIGKEVSCLWSCGGVEGEWEAGSMQGCAVVFWCFRPFARLQSVAGFKNFHSHPGTAMLRLGSCPGLQCGGRRGFGITLVAVRKPMRFAVVGVVGRFDMGGSHGGIELHVIVLMLA